MKVQPILGLLAWSAAVVSGFGRGAPLTACSSMFPQGHGVDAQRSDPPFMLLVSATTVTTGQRITVTLQAKGDARFPYYEGMFVQARLAGDCEDTHPVGQFILESDETFMKLMDCGKMTGSAVSHKESSHQTLKRFTWVAPQSEPGRVYFRATVAKNRTHFWSNVFSDFVEDPTDTSERPSQPCPAVMTGSATTTAAALPLLLPALLLFFFSLVEG